MALILSTGTTPAYYPSVNGTTTHDDALIALSGASGIVGTIQYLTSENTWVDIPDNEGNASLSAEYLKPVLGGSGFTIRISVTTLPTADSPYGIYQNLDGAR